MGGAKEGGFIYYLIIVTIMGGFSKGTEGGSATFIKIKGLEKSSPEHYFEVGWQRIEDNKFVGTLVNIEASSYEYEGAEKQTIKMTFQDEEKFQLDIAYNSISRSIINSILGWMKENKGTKMVMELSLYMNKQGYKSLGFLINGERAPWLYSMDEQKTLIERIENKKGELISNDYSAYDDKLKEGVADIKKRIENGKPVSIHDTSFGAEEVIPF